MNAVESTAPVETEKSRLRDKIEIDRLIEYASEWFNPILVKEARQSLKSRQFMLTFALVLAAAWFWTILGVGFMTPEIFHAARGREMLTGYYWILIFPLFVIVPFGAFRSLAVEVEDGTFELISVSTLSPRQIINGKLASAFLQALIYFSALSPCIAFTYLLRGVDFLMIASLLFYTVGVCVVLCIFGLFLATVSTLRIWQLFFSIGLIITLFGGFVLAGTGVSEFLRFTPRLPTELEAFWVSQAAIVSTTCSFAWLMHAAAAARITFPSENRSTRLRWIMILQHVLLVAWMVYTFVEIRDPLILVIMAIVGAVYWSTMGSMMIGETAQLSQRIRRSLPRSDLGRTVLSWFTPGPYTGYQFAVLNSLTLAVFITIFLMFATSFAIDEQFMTISACCWIAFSLTAFVAFYLGIALILVRMASKATATGPMFGFLATILVVLTGCLIPFLIRVSLEDYYLREYEWWEFTSPFAVLRQMVLLPTMPGPPGLEMRLRVTTISCGAIVYLINLIWNISSVRTVREEAPQRVLQEIQQVESPVSSVNESTQVHPLDE